MNLERMKFLFPWGIVIFSLSFFFGKASVVAAVPWKISFGTGPGEVGFYNSAVNKTIQESAPLGPLAFRIHNSDAWIVDSIGGKIICFDSKGKLKHTFHVSNLPENTLIEDFAFAVDAQNRISGLWIGDGSDLSIRLLKFPEGKELIRFGGSGNVPGRFLQIHQIETDPSGRVYVGDYGRNVIVVYDHTGKFLWEIPWQSSGFALDSKGNLSLLVFSPNSGHIWIRQDPSGGIIESVHLGFGKHLNARLWEHSSSGGIYVTFIPPGGYRGSLHLVHFSSAGAVLSKRAIKPPMALNRFLDLENDSRGYIAVADYGRAPQGYFTINRFDPSGKK